MKKLLSIFVLLSVMMAACKKDDSGCPSECQNGGTLQTDCSCLCPTGFSGDQCQNDDRPDCEKNNRGWIIFDCWEADPYVCYVDGANKGTVSAWGRLEVEVSAGYHTIRALQQSGYYLYPTDLSNSLTVVKCHEYTWKVQD